MTKALLIDEIEVDEHAGLLVRPRLATAESFEHIYRAGAGVRWNKTEHAFAAYEVGAMPPEWWFRQIVAAVAGEYGRNLVLQSTTRWKNVSESQRLAISEAANEHVS